MNACVAPSPPWRSPWSRAYVVVLWVVTWTSGRASLPRADRPRIPVRHVDPARSRSPARHSEAEPPGTPSHRHSILHPATTLTRGPRRDPAPNVRAARHATPPRRRRDPFHSCRRGRSGRLARHLRNDTTAHTHLHSWTQRTPMDRRPAGRTRKTDAYDPSLGRGKEERERISGCCRVQKSEAARQTPLFTSPDFLCQAGFLCFGVARPQYHSLRHRARRHSRTVAHSCTSAQECASLIPSALRAHARDPRSGRTSPPTRR
jgi:hypothetical protein